MQMFHVYFMDKIYHTTLIITAPNTSLRTLFPGGGGGALPLQGGHHARTEKNIKKGLFFTDNVCAYNEKGIKIDKIREKGILLQQLIYLFRVGKPDKILVWVF